MNSQEHGCRGDHCQRWVNQQGLLTLRLDRVGNATTFDYIDLDEDGVPDALSEMVEPGGRTTTFAYSGGRLQTITDFAGRVTAMTYDAAGRFCGPRAQRRIVWLLLMVQWTFAGVNRKK